MEIEMVLCPCCGKQTFKRKFCIFCGATIVEKPIRKVEATPKGEGPSSDRKEFDILDERLEKLHELRETFLAESERLQSDWVLLKDNLEAKLMLLRKNVEDAEKRLEEASFLHSINEVATEDYEETSKTLIRDIDNNKKAAKDLEERIHRIEDFVAKLPKKKVDKQTERGKTNGKDSKKKLLKLEKAYEAGTLSKEVYEKLKTKYA